MMVRGFSFSYNTELMSMGDSGDGDCSDWITFQLCRKSSRKFDSLSQVCVFSFGSGFRFLNFCIRIYLIYVEGLSLLDPVGQSCPSSAVIIVSPVQRAKTTLCSSATGETPVCLRFQCMRTEIPHRLMSNAGCLVFPCMCPRSPCIEAVLLNSHAHASSYSLV